MMTTGCILVLGGTGDARQLVERLATSTNFRVILSLAGRTKAPLPQAGHTRSGGFGGAEGLAQFLRAEKVNLLIDATHPFAARISANAASAAKMAQVPLIRLGRPAWKKADGDCWIDAETVGDAVARLGHVPRVVFLAIGRQELSPFRTAPQHHYIVRSVDAVDSYAQLRGAEYILARGPFNESDERALFHRRGIEIVVAKNSGGNATYGKIAAARALGIPVIMVARPLISSGTPMLSIDEVLDAVAHLLAVPTERGE